MRQLLILRHAKSSWDDPNQPDHSRPLNERGRQAAELVKTTMRNFGLIPELVLVSSSRRTLQTLQALQPFVPAPKIEPLDALYLATSEDMLTVLQQIPEAVRSVLLIGHNPGLHDLAAYLGAPADEPGGVSQINRLREAFPTGALAELSFDCPWMEVGRGSGTLRRFITPRDRPESAN